MKQQQNNVGSVVSALHVLYSTCRPNLGVIFSVTLVFDASVRIITTMAQWRRKGVAAADTVPPSGQRTCRNTCSTRPAGQEERLSPFSGCVPNPASASYEVQVLCLPKNTPTSSFPLNNGTVSPSLYFLLASPPFSCRHCYRWPTPPILSTFFVYL